MSILDDNIIEVSDKIVQDCRKMFKYYELYSFDYYGNKSMLMKGFRAEKMKSTIYGKDLMPIRENYIMLYEDQECPEFFSDVITLFGQSSIDDWFDVTSNDTLLSNGKITYEEKYNIDKLNRKLYGCLRSYKNLRITIRCTHTNVYQIHDTILPLFVRIILINGERNRADYGLILKDEYKNDF